MQLFICSLYRGSKYQGFGVLTVSLPVSGWGHSGDPLRSQGSRVRRLLIIQNWIQEGVEAAAAGGQPVVKWVGVQNYF